MANKTVTLPMTDAYPFCLSTDYEQPRTTIQVRKSLPMDLEPRYVMKEKIRCLKSLGSNLIVALLTTSEEDNCLNLVFEYVHKKLEEQQWTIDPEVVDRIQKELVELSGILAAHWMSLDLKFENIGLDKYFRLKYFLGFQFKIDKSLNKDLLGNRYKCQIEEMFGKGGRFRRATSPARISKPEYYSTMDTTSGKVGSSPEVNQKDKEGQSGGRLMMKKSATVSQNPSQKAFSELEEWWQGSNEGDNKMMMSVGCNQYNHQATKQIKTVKMEDLGARINKLKNYMKEVTGKTPKGKSTLGQIFVKVDENNLENKIYQENKMYITPNYTKLEKKIAQFRASRFYRGNCQKQILYTKDNKGYILTTKEKIENKQAEQSKPKALNFLKKQPLQLTSTPKTGEKKVPQYLLQKEKSKANIAANEKKANEERKPEKQEMNSSKIRESSSFQTEYKKLSQNDKYCEEFMYFLEDDDHEEKKDGEMSPLTRLISHIGTEVNNEKGFPRGERASETSNSESSNSAVQIHNRVQKAIRNSLKLISGLKYRQSQAVK